MRFSIFSLDSTLANRLHRIGDPIDVPGAFGRGSATAERVFRDALDAGLVSKPGQYLVVWVWDDDSCGCRTFTVESRLVIA